ncbi:MULTISPECIES: MATE family efflux transporter [Roseburia]|uniref:MATE family efflux transporter n=1 Tax=Roseburia TaxID=841 RepID=UPI003A7F11FA
MLIARYIGEKSTGQIGELLGGAITVFAIISAALFVVMVFFAKQLAVLMQAPQDFISMRQERQLQLLQRRQ